MFVDVHVTQPDIDHGVPWRYRGRPQSIAIQRLLKPEYFVEVGTLLAVIRRHDVPVEVDYEQLCNLPDAAHQFRRLFDDGKLKKVTPFSFGIDIDRKFLLTERDRQLQARAKPTA